MPEPGLAARLCAGAIAVLGLPALARAQSAADLAARVTIDGRLGDFTAVESVFRAPDVCAALVPPLVCAAEERTGDSSAGATRDVRQVHVTWDANRLYVGVDASLDGMGLVVLIDVRPGGLADLAALSQWRRGVRCSDVLEPDFIVTCDDVVQGVELWRTTGATAIEAVDNADFAAAATFGGARTGLEIAVPWTTLFPGAGFETNPEPGAPLAPMFVLPQESSRAGLRVAALVVDARDGFGALDVAPDPRAGVPLDPRTAVDIDRAAHVAWDEARSDGRPAFVDFSAAVQTQAAARFLPEPPARAAPLAIRELQTFDGSTPSALLLGDAGRTLEFRFAVAAPAPPEIYLTARVLSLRGERVRELYRDARRLAGGATPFADPQADVWDGRDQRGRPAPGGVYVLQLRAALSPGGTATVLQHAVTVVR